MSDNESKPKRLYPKSVKKILVIDSAAAKTGVALEVDQKSGEVVEAPKEKKRRVSKKYRNIEREMRAFSHAAGAYFDNYAVRHELSNLKKDNGSIRDLLKNSHKASEAATQVLCSESKVYRDSKMARKLHKRVSKLQSRLY